MQPTPPRPVNNPSFHVDPALYSQSHVFIRQDSVRKPLQQPYNGPYKVISRISPLMLMDIKRLYQSIVSNQLSLLFHLPLLHCLHLLLPSHLLPKLLDQVVVYTFLRKPKTTFSFTFVFMNYDIHLWA